MQLTCIFLRPVVFFHNASRYTAVPLVISSAVLLIRGKLSKVFVLKSAHCFSFKKGLKTIPNPTHKLLHHCISRSTFHGQCFWFHFTGIQKSCTFFTLALFASPDGWHFALNMNKIPSIFFGYLAHRGPLSSMTFKMSIRCLIVWWFRSKFFI